MMIELRNTWASVVSSSDEEDDWLRGYLTFERRAYFGGKVRTVPYSMLRRDLAFPAGMLPLIRRAAADEGIAVTVRDCRYVPADAPPPAAWPPPSVGWLRDYQVDAMKAVVDNTRGLLWLTTGAGKTEIAIGLATALPTRWLFLVHRASLLHQTAERFERRTGEQAGVIGGGSWDVQRFTVATFQSLWKGFGKQRVQDLLQGVGGLLIDECHTLPADTFMRVAMATSRAYWRVGLSGTPLARGDRRSVQAVGALGPVIYRLVPDQLISRGLLAKPDVTFVQVDQTWNGRHTKSNYQRAYKALVVDSRVRNAALVDIVKRAEKPCMVFVRQVGHGRGLTKHLESAGMSVEFVDGSDPEPRRRAALEALERCDLQAVVCTVIFQEGVDVPSLMSVVNAGGGKSSIAALQRIGRGMRVVEGKSAFQVWDIWDVGERWVADHARLRARAIQRDGHDVYIGSSTGEKTLLKQPRKRKARKQKTETRSR